METDSALSFFPHGKTPRAEQIRAINSIEGAFASGKKVVAFQGPTGSGKSFVGMSFAKQAEARQESTHLLTPQKVLQMQYLQDFAPPQVEPIQGRMNYACSLEPWMMRNAARGKCIRTHKTSLIKECLKYGTVEQATLFQLAPEAHKCPYWEQLQKAIDSPITLYNFHSFLYQQRLGRFGARDLMIMDEAHNAESVLLQFVSLVLSDEVLRKIDVRLDLRIQTQEQLIAWLERERVDEKIKEALGDAAKGEGAAEGFSAEETEQLKGILERVEMVKLFMNVGKWIIDVTEDTDEANPTDRTRKLRIRPLFVGMFARHLLWSQAKRVLAMSATILDPKIWARNLGIAQADLAYTEVPCLFPVKNRPIILDYAGDMGWKNQEATLPKLYSKIEQLLQKHEGQRGIIHGHSERLCKLILEKVRSPRFVHLDQFKGRDKAELLKTHVLRPDSVIVASGFHEGVDLKDGLSRFQIIAKVPWPGMNDKWVKARMEEDGSFLSYQTALKFLQSTGRSVRHHEDWAITYVTDQGFESFAARCAWLLPKWFREAVQKK